MVAQKLAETALKVGEKLIPPVDTPEEKLLLWRLTIVAYNFAMGLALAIHIALVCGYFPGFSGYARADAIDTVRQDTVDLKRILIDKQIYDTLKDYCLADSPQKLFLYKRLQEFKHEYYEATKENYVMPTCAEIGL